jgi:hypothetical protein
MRANAPGQNAGYLRGSVPILPRIGSACLPAEGFGLSLMSRLDRMRGNPAGDWRIEDVEALCAEFEVRCTAPRGGGSHYKVSHPSQR